MARASVDIPDSKMEEVIDLMAAEKPITKKRACEILGIAYNTTRLDNLMEEFLERKARLAQRKKAKRGKPLDEAEKKDIIESYLEREPLGDIAERQARSIATIKNFLEFSGLPMRDTDCDYFNPPMVGDKLVRECYLVGEIVYSTQYQELAEVRAQVKARDIAYRIWLSDSMQYACVPWYELADMTEIVRQYKVNLKLAKLATPAAVQINETLRKIKMVKKERE